MPTKVVTDFLERAQRSGLIATDKLPPLLEDMKRSGVDVDAPAAVADALVANDTLTRWQADNLLQGKHKGFFLGSYRLLKPLGRGGMGTVYLAQHERMRRLCALKVLPQTRLQENSSMLDRFYVEAQAVAALDHQNIVRAYDVNQDEKDNRTVHYLVMEYVEGKDIYALVSESGKLDYVQTAEYLRQTANGLAHAHQNGLVHRDIKPANLLVDKKGILKVLDLGLARFYDDSAKASLTADHNETVLGTADYLSPEQALNSHNVDHRTDLYSLGCTGYFMLTGHPPFPEGSVAQRLVAHQVKTPEPIGSERPDVPPDLIAIIDKMMAKNPDRRYQTAAEVAATLAAWLIANGGEEWKRQHTEIVGDSGLLALLASRAPAAAPTAVPAAKSPETELGLAPLEDEMAAAPAPAKPTPARAPPRPKSGRGVAAPAGHEDLGLAPLEDEAVPAAAQASEATPRSPADVSTGRAAAVESAPLPALADLQPLSAEDQFGDLSNVAMLETLDQADLLGTLTGQATVETLPNAWQAQPAAGSGIGGTAGRKQTASRPAGGVLSVGLPILIGSAGGLVLVGLVVLLFYLTSSSGPSAGPVTVALKPPVTPATPPATPPAVSPLAAAPTATPSPSPPAVAPSAPPASPPPSPAPSVPLPGPLAFGPQTPPTEAVAAKPEVPPPAPGEPPAAPAKSKKPKKDKSPPPPAVEQGPAAAPPAAAPGPSPPPAGPGPGAKPGPEPAARTETTPVQEIVVTADQKRQLFAAVKTVAFQCQSDDKRQFSPLNLMVQRELEDSVKGLGWAPTKTGPPTLHVALTARPENPYLVYRLTAALECPGPGSGPVQVWSAEQEIGRVVGGQLTPTVLGLMRKEAGKFFNGLEREYRLAVAAHGKGG